MYKRVFKKNRSLASMHCLRRDAESPRIPLNKPLLFHLSHVVCIQYKLIYFIFYWLPVILHSVIPDPNTTASKSCDFVNPYNSWKPELSVLLPLDMPMYYLLN